MRVILDSDLAKIYGVPTFRFNEAIKRNRYRFPIDFMFQLTAEEAAALRSQIAILELLKRDKLNLDIFWLKDESLEDSANLPDPDVIAAEIVEDLEAALQQFTTIASDLKK
jgi:hypothetical protein